MPSPDPGEFAPRLLDALPQLIAVIDGSGLIQWTNRAWRAFYEANGGDPAKCGVGANYFAPCSGSAAAGEPDAGQAQNRICLVIDGVEDASHFEYPCHSPDEQRWFMMRCSRIEGAGSLFAITHENITERKLAELRVQQLAMLDGLTGIANRRRFDKAIAGEWRRARRVGGYVSLILIDVDEFKAFNDHLGHLAGDDCLRRVAGALAPLANRPGDLAARYGGEEFAILLGDINLEGAVAIAETARRAVAGLAVPHPAATGPGHVSISAGVASFRLSPQSTTTPRDLQKAADDCLYQAKRAGRNRVVAEPAVRIGRFA